MQLFLSKIGIQLQYSPMSGLTGTLLGHAGCVSIGSHSKLTTQPRPSRTGFHSQYSELRGRRGGSGQGSGGAMARGWIATAGLAAKIGRAGAGKASGDNWKDG